MDSALSSTGVCGYIRPGLNTMEMLNLSAKVLVSFQSGRNHKGNVNKASSLQGSLSSDERLAVEKEELWAEGQCPSKDDLRRRPSPARLRPLWRSVAHTSVEKVAQSLWRMWLTLL